MKKLIYAFSALALFFASCSSDSDSTPDDSSSTVLLKRMIETDVDDEVYTTVFTYDGNKIVKATDDDGYYEKYFYTGEVITKIEFYNDIDELEQTELFTYNASQELITFQQLSHVDEVGRKEVYIHEGASIGVSYYVGDLTTQTDAEGTATITISNGEISQTSGLGVTTNFTYDTKNSPFRNVLGMGKIAISNSDASFDGANHNAVSIVWFDGEERSAMFTYTYNASNYPVTCAQADSVVGNSSFQFFYE